MSLKHRTRSPPTTRNIPELGISLDIPLTEYRGFGRTTPERNPQVLGRLFYGKQIVNWSFAHSLGENRV